MGENQRSNHNYQIIYSAISKCLRTTGGIYNSLLAAEKVSMILPGGCFEN